MKVGKAIKKIVALGVGATMMGATILGATAVSDLKDYPNFFLDGGSYDGVIVVRGETDSLAAVDIAANMYYAGSGTTTGTTTTSVTGDAWLVGTGSKKLEMANNNQSTTDDIIAETPRQINTFIGDEELDALADSAWKTNEKDYTYQQFLFFDNVDPTSGVVKYAENDDDETGVFFSLKNARQIARYKMEFTSTAESDVTDANGAADETGLYLDDFEDTDLTFMGKTYNVVQARRPSSNRELAGLKLVLMAGAVRDTLLEGESGTYTVEGEEFAVELTYVDADEAKFTVNGEATNKLKDGDTYVLKSGQEVGVSEILYQDYAGGVHSATFYLGAQKVELQDTTINDTTGAATTNDLVIGSETIDGAAVIISGTSTGSKYRITGIELNMTTEDEFWVGEGQKLSEVIDAAGEESEVLFAGAWDVEYKGLTAPATKDLRLKSSSARRYKLQLNDGDGNAADIPVAYAGTSRISIGEEDQNGSVSRTSQKRLILWEDGTDVGQGNQSHAVHKDDYVVVTGGTASDGSAKSYLLQYQGADRQTKTSPKIKFKNMGSGDTLEYSVTSITTDPGTTDTVATIKIGGYSFVVNNASSTLVDDFSVNVDVNGNGALATGAYITFVDYYGSQWTFNVNGTGGSNGAGNVTNVLGITQSTPNADDYDNIVPAGVSLNITQTTDPEVRTALTGLTLVTPSGETEVSYGYTSMGTFVKFTSPSGDPNELTLTYPAEQRLPQLYLTAGATSSSTRTTGGGQDRVTIPTTATKLPDEVTNVKSQHIITVGGPCANAVTAAVMYTEQGKSVPANCAEGFNAGQAIVALYDVGDKVAMVVAGYSGDDTRRAGKVIAARAGELSGSQVTVEGTTLSNAQIVKVK